MIWDSLYGNAQNQRSFASNKSEAVAGVMGDKVGTVPDLPGAARKAWWGISGIMTASADPIISPAHCF